MVRDVIESLSRRMEHTMPIALRHEHHQAVLTDTSVINQHADMFIRMRLVPLTQRGFYSLAVRDVKR